MKPTGALKAFLDAGKGNTRVLGSVERYLLSRPAEDRSSLVIHPSEMASDSWCHRAQYFWLSGHTPKHEAIGLRKALIFEAGHAIHNTWQTWFAEMNQLIGEWYCHTHKKAWFGKRSEHKSRSKYSCNIKYKEIQLNYAPLRIAGKADGWLVEFEKPLLLEVKSIGEGSVRWYAPELVGETFAKTWENIKAPFKDHIMQAQIYMKLGELMGIENFPTEALMLYEAKGIHEVKEFVVQKSDFGVADLFDTAASIVDAVGRGVPPLCNINGVAGCKKCSHYTEETHERISN